MMTPLLLVLAFIQPDPSPLHSYIATDDEKVSFTSSVKKNGDKYVYTYVIKNHGAKPWLVGCSVPDQAAGLGGGIAHYYQLAPGKSATIRVTHEDGPVFHKGILSCFNKESHKDWQEENHVEMSGTPPSYFFQMSGAVSGFFPKGRSAN